jgi:hypothetical protein
VGPASFVITVIDYDTKQPVANAMVSLYDEGGSFLMNLGFTDSSGVLMIADFTLPPVLYSNSCTSSGHISALKEWCPR